MTTLKLIRESLNNNLLDNVCAGCGASSEGFDPENLLDMDQAEALLGLIAEEPDPGVHEDKYGFFWCKDCDHRERLFDWGVIHHFPEVLSRPMSIAAGATPWMLGVTIGEDAMIWLALGLIEYWDSQTQAVEMPYELRSIG
jgi:hypothetical protein